MTKTLAHSIRAATLAAALLYLTTSNVRAEDLPRWPGPPLEAIAACEGKSAQDACEVKLRDGAPAAGTCVSFDGSLACRPDRPPRRGPPPEAVEACAGEAEGAACAVTLGGNTLDGICTKAPHGDMLACRPSRMPPPPSR